MATKKTLTLKLLIDKKANKVIFGEANKDFVDFLFSIMALPIGALITLLSKQNMVGCLGELYGSIQKLNETYIQPNVNKDSILKIKSVLISNQPTTTSSNSSTTTAKNYYLCDVCYNYVTHVSKESLCPCNRGKLRRKLTYYENPNEITKAAAMTSTSNKTGYVQGVATYMVMDDLAVMPMSTISSITMLNQFNIQDVRSLEEKVVNLGMEEGLMMLKASLESKTVLTDVFLVLMNKKAKVNANKKKRRY